MSYSDFTLEMLRRNFGLTVQYQSFFPAIGSLTPAAWLEEALADGLGLAFASEKARSEFIVAPVLRACRQALSGGFQIFSGIRLDADPAAGLKGHCDFIIGRSATVLALQSPLMVIVEAKKNDMEEGIGQCGAEMLGARVYNEQDGHPVPVLYGCVTTGESWQFLKLESSSLSLHPDRFSLKEIGSILWFLVECLKDVDRQAAAAAA
jgi:hypothetical protein